MRLSEPWLKRSLPRFRKLPPGRCLNYCCLSYLFHWPCCWPNYPRHCYLKLRHCHYHYHRLQLLWQVPHRH